MKRGLLLIISIAAALFGMALVGCAFWYYARAGGNFLWIPEIIAFVGICVTWQGIVIARRIARNTPTPVERAMTPFRKRGLLIGWIAGVLFGLFLVGWAIWYQCRAGSELVISVIVGFVGIYVTWQGVANVRRIARNTSPK